MPSSERKPVGVFLSVDTAHGAHQLSIDVDYEGGGGHGYRVAGPKYDGTSCSVMRHRLTQRDISELRVYLALAEKAL